MKKIIRIYILLFVGLYSITSSSLAGEPRWERVYFPAYEGYVVSYEKPSDWQNSEQNTVSSRFYNYPDGKWRKIFFNSFSSSLKNVKALNKRIGLKTPSPNFQGGMDFRVSLYHLPRPIKFANWVQKKKQSWKDYAMKVYGEGFVDIGGKKSFYYDYSGLTILKDGKEVEAINPTGKRVTIQFNDKVLLEVSFGIRYFEEQFIALKPVCERMLNSIQVTPIEKLAEKKLPEVYVSPEVVIADGGMDIV